MEGRRTHERERTGSVGAAPRSRSRAEPSPAKGSRAEAEAQECLPTGRLAGWRLSAQSVRPDRDGETGTTTSAVCFVACSVQSSGETRR